MMLTVKDPKRFDVKSTFEQEIPDLWRNSTYLRKRGCLDVDAVSRFRRVRRRTISCGSTRYAS
jgi:hypothetical protein